MLSLYRTPSQRVGPDHPSYQRLGGYEHKIRTLVLANLQNPCPPEEFGQILKETGIQPVAERIGGLWELSKSLHGSEGYLSVEELGENPGIFLIKDGECPVAVFKPGSHRACTENAVKGLAHVLGLGEFFVEGRFGVLGRPPKVVNRSSYLSRGESDTSDSAESTSDSEKSSSDSEEAQQPTEGLFETLAWGSRLITYLDRPKAMVGFLEKYISDSSPTEEKDLVDYVKMLLLILVAGIRDVKSDGHKNYTIFDADVAFPRRTEPLLPTNGSDELFKIFLNQQACQTDIPMLGDGRQADTVLTDAQLKQLADFVTRWDERSVVDFLRSQKIRFADSRIESASDKTERLLDDTGSKVKLEFMQSGTDPNDFELSETEGTPSLVKKPLHFTMNEECMFKEEQIVATLTRFRRIRAFFKAYQMSSNKEAVRALFNRKALSQEEGELFRALNFIREEKDSILTPMNIVEFLDVYFGSLRKYYVRKGSSLGRKFGQEVARKDGLDMVGRRLPPDFSPETVKKTTETLRALPRPPSPSLPKTTPATCARPLFLATKPELGQNS